MDLQTLIVYLILAAALFFVLRRVWQRLRAFTKAKSGDCATGCGKCSPQK